MCFEYKILPIPYFLDECTLWEIDNIIDNLPYTDRNLWESSRLNSYTIAKANFKGIGKITDYISFPWEKNQPKGDTSITNEEVDRLRNLAQKFINNEK